MRSRRVRAATTAVAACLALLAAAGAPAGAAAPDAVPPAPTQVLAATALPGGAAPSALSARLADRLPALLRSPALGRATMSVVDVASGEEVYETFAGRAQAPASTLKLLTALAVLRALGPETRLHTRVVQGRKARTVVLVGAGDATLTRTPTDTTADGQPYAPASLTELAERTARVLREAGRSSVRLRFDDTLFSHERTAPGWPASYVASGVVSPVSALSADSGRAAAGSLARSTDPAAAAASYFAQRLREAGVTVRGAPARAAAQPQAHELAAVQSPTIATLVEWMLTVSDNDLAEALAHLAGAHEGAGSFAGGAQAMRATLAALGVEAPLVDGARIADGSGLSLQDALPAGLLSRALAAAARPSPQTAAYWPVFSGNPVAGLTGTLAARFTGRADAGRGVVRAKTGTLTGVNALAGTVRDDQGRLLAFAVLADRVVAKYPAEAQLDRVAAALRR